MNDIVKINDTKLQVIEFQGQRVATLAQIDSVHKRPEGTARRNFNANKQHLLEGEDFCKLSADEFRTRFPGIISERVTEDMTLMFESGYLMLVKSFTDDLAWQVQRQLVKGYFRGKTTSAAQTKQRSRTPLQQVKIINFVGDAIKDVPGIRLGRLAAAKLKAFAEHTGLDFSDFRRALPPLPLDQMVHLNPTQIGVRVAELSGQPKISGQAINKVLLSLGLQRKVEDGYALTEAGIKHGEMHDYKAENSHSGLQIDWYESVVSLVRENLPIESSKRGKRAIAAMNLRPSPDEPQGSPP